MMKEKEHADQRLAEVLVWWDNQASVPPPTPVKRGDRSGTRPIAVVWKAPYYRIRLGPYTARSRAEEVLSTVRSTFPDAFVAPERLRSAQ